MARRHRDPVHAGQGPDGASFLPSFWPVKSIVDEKMSIHQEIVQKLGCDLFQVKDAVRQAC